MIIYNLFPLLAGKFGDWEKHMRAGLQDGFRLGFRQSHSADGRLRQPLFHCRLLCPEPAPGRLPQSRKTAREQLAEAVLAAQGMGLKMMIDLVINHCSADSGLLESHPEWFAWESRGQVVHPSCDENGKRVVWKDLAKFDHRQTRDQEGLYQFFPVGREVPHRAGLPGLPV